MAFTETGKEKEKREAYMKANKERGIRAEKQKEYEMFGTTEQNIPKVDAMGNVAGMKKGGVAKTVTKEMEYDYKTGKKSFSGTTAQRDRHAEKEGKIVAKHAAYDKSMGMKSGGFVKAADGIAKRGKTKGKMC